MNRKFESFLENLDELPDANTAPVQQRKPQRSKRKKPVVDYSEGKSSFFSAPSGDAVAGVMKRFTQVLTHNPLCGLDGAVIVSLIVLEHQSHIKPC